MNRTGSTGGSDAVPSNSSSSPRLVSLDAFRGFTIAGMLLVNNTAVGNAVPPQLVHADWGQPITFADLIFPWFLFIVGVAIPFSANGTRERLLPRWRRGVNVIQRSALLFGIGLLLESSLQKQPVFSLGVLQLIALAYLVGRSLYRIPTLWRTIVAALLLAGYGAALTLIPVPGAPPGEFSPEHNLALHLNRTLFASLSLSGLTSVLPTSAMVLLGSAAGDILRIERWKPVKRAGVLAIVGLLLLSVGWLWHLFLIMNKPVWTPSYIAYAAGWGAVGIAVFYILADVLKFQGIFRPLIIFGANPLVAYAGAILFKVHVLQEWRALSPLTGKLVTLQQAWLDWCIREAGERIAGGWLYTCLYILLWWLVCGYLYRRKIFLRA
ncbi:MAG: heparan-alpha-glucosaminide N-acetyltransferase domain-containing protein [Armatimonadota bacterium]